MPVSLPLVARGIGALAVGRAGTASGLGAHAGANLGSQARAGGVGLDRRTVPAGRVSLSGPSNPWAPLEQRFGTRSCSRQPMSCPPMASAEDGAAALEAASERLAWPSAQLLGRPRSRVERRGNRAGT
jgi:hypothetical protein